MSSCAGPSPHPIALSINEPLDLAFFNSPLISTLSIWALGSTCDEIIFSFTHEEATHFPPVKATHTQQAPGAGGETWQPA